MSKPSFLDGQRLLTTRQAAAYIGVCDRTMWTLGNSGQIPTVRFGAGHRQSVRFDQRDLDAWIESCKQGGAR